MTFNPNLQFRATIIRGKAKTELDNLLPAYGSIINDTTPSSSDDFSDAFNAQLRKLLPSSTKKTLDNHRTEIAGKLFAMYFKDENGVVHCSDRTRVLLETSDQPLFFKDLCFKFQFPNGMDSIQGLREKLAQHLSIRQFPFIIRLLLTAANESVALTVNEIAFYVLNSLMVLRGEVSPEEVLRAIVSDRRSGRWKNTKSYVGKPGEASSKTMQHIREQLNLLELANLVRIYDSVVRLNPREEKALDIFASQDYAKPLFDVYKYDIGNPDDSKRLRRDWDDFMARMEVEAEQHFVTPLSALGLDESDVGIPTDTYDNPIESVQTYDNVNLGWEGEQWVYANEKKRVGNFNPRLLAKVKAVGHIKGLGYDIQTVVADDDSEEPEFARYLEVKSTKRVTAPDPNDDSWEDWVNLTRSEFKAAQQHGKSYHIHRVYFTTQGVKAFVVKDPYNKSLTKHLTITPTTYRLDFKGAVVDEVISKTDNDEEKQ